jgi:amidase
MQVFDRSAIGSHAVGAEWPDLLGTVQVGETFVVETERFNAVNGPIHVDGILAGDDIAIHVEQIEMVGPFEAPVDARDADAEPVELDYEDGCFYFPRHFRVQARPTVGNLGVLPAPSEEILALSRRFQKNGGAGWRQLMNAPRGRHCHQDCPWMTTGSVLHIKAQTDGAGLCVGDVHGYQPAGQMAFAGIEVSAAVHLRVERSKGWLVDWPLIETEDEIMVYSSYASLQGAPRSSYDDVVRQAYRSLQAIVADRTGCDAHEASAIVAAAVDIRNCVVSGMLPGYDPGIAGDPAGDIAVVAAISKDSLSGR